MPNKRQEMLGYSEPYPSRNIVKLTYTPKADMALARSQQNSISIYLEMIAAAHLVYGSVQAMEFYGRPDFEMEGVHKVRRIYVHFRVTRFSESFYLLAIEDFSTSDPEDDRIEPYKSLVDRRNGTPQKFRIDVPSGISSEGDRYFYFGFCINPDRDVHEHPFIISVMPFCYDIDRTLNGDGDVFYGRVPYLYRYELTALDALAPTAAIVSNYDADAEAVEATISVKTDSVAVLEHLEGSRLDDILIEKGGFNWIGGGKAANEAKAKDVENASVDDDTLNSGGGNDGTLQRYKGDRAFAGYGGDLMGPDTGVRSLGKELRALAGIASTASEVHSEL